MKLRNFRWDVGCTRFPYTVRIDDAPQIRFSATLGQEPEVAPVWQLRARVLLTEVRTVRAQKFAASTNV